jgi:aspartyl-tRNA(Asn)/glutamyl-tRNA(Gln) amidotransferase subunit A
VIDEDVYFLSIAELGRLFRAHELSPVELVTGLLERIDRVDEELNSFITVLHDSAVGEAQQAERRLREESDPPPLLGVPIALKDNIATAGIRTTLGSPIYREWVPDADAVCVQRLRDAGAIVVGKSNMFEFAYGEAAELFGHVRNPWDRTRTTAGSSTGSVASVAAGLAYGGVATDTGGSIRVPAAFCGVVGLKPTYARISYEGIVETTSRTMAHAGPVARTVEDAATIFDVLAGAHTSEAVRGADVSGRRLAVAARGAGELLDEQVEAALDEAERVFEALGVQLVPVEIPDLLLARAALWAIASAEAAEIHHETLAARGDEYHPVVRARLERGAAVSGAAYVRAQRVRQWIADRLDETLAGTDALLLPVAPIPAYQVGARHAEVRGTVEEVSQLVTRYTPLASVTGRPAIAIPCGFADGLPVGLQLVGGARDESTVLELGHAYQCRTAWHSRRPSDLLEGART